MESWKWKDSDDLHVLYKYIKYYDSRNWNEVSVMCLIQFHLLIQISYQVSTDYVLQQSNAELDAWGFLLARMNAMFSYVKISDLYAVCPDISLICRWPRWKTTVRLINHRYLNRIQVWNLITALGAKRGKNKCRSNKVNKHNHSR